MITRTEIIVLAIKQLDRICDMMRKSYKEEQ